MAGPGDSASMGDGGPATAAFMLDPSGLVFDAAGNLLIADDGLHVVRMIDAAGVIHTLAGTGEAGFSGDGGPATTAALNVPTDVAVDLDGNSYVADGDNHRIRIVHPDGTIETYSLGLP